VRRSIALVTSSRADYSLLYWPLRELKLRADIQVRLIALGSHLSPEFGATIRDIEKDGFHVDERIECLLSSDTDVGMAKTIGLATLSLADLLGSMRPDLLVITADRYEMLAPASVALALRIPVVHIEGGEVSEGAIDDAVRNALTKLSHVHLTSTERARSRVIAMGEEEWRVHSVGAAALDHLKRSALLSRLQLEGCLGLDLGKSTTLVTYHPTTIARDTTREADALFDAIRALPGQILFCYPNADAGSRTLMARVEKISQERADSKVFVNLDPVIYWSLLPHVDVMVGNSSSGIIEAASFALPVVDVGIRQQGRERGRNVLHAEASSTSILEQAAIARSDSFRRSLEGMENPYGDGQASARMADVIAAVPLGEELLMKRACP
jgi:UDP-hydrolysing UDP-N-acetyl-D-glucosamine 2-epimerase